MKMFVDGGPVGRVCHESHDVDIRDLRACTHAHLGFADLHILDLHIRYLRK